MLIIYLVIAALVHLFLFLIWKSSDLINTLIKMAFFVLLVVEIYFLFKS